MHPAPPRPHRPVPVVVAAGHPSLGLATSTVGRVLADALHATGAYRVGYAGWGIGTPTTTAPYPTVHDDAYGERALIHLVRDFLRTDAGPAPRVVVVLMGPIVRQHRIARRLRLAGLRDATLLVSHLPVDAAPLNAAAMHVLRSFDVVVPFTEFAARAVDAGERTTGIGAPRRTHPIGLPAEPVFTPLDGPARRAARRDLIDADDDSFVIGSFARNATPKRLDLFLYLVRVLARGEWGRCSSCGAVAIDPLDPTTMVARRVDRCGRCQGTLDHAEPDPAVRAYVQTQELDDDELRQGEGFDLDALVAQHQLADVVRIDRSLRRGPALAREVVARRMAALDVHLVCAEASAWELSVLETGACGVPNVVPDYAGPAEYAAPFATLVPVAAWGAHPTGVQLGTLALDHAVDALDRLRTDPARREAQGAAGPATAAGHSPAEFARRWHLVLDALDVRRAPDPTRRARPAWAAGGSVLHTAGI